MTAAVYAHFIHSDTEKHLRTYLKLAVESSVTLQSLPACDSPIIPVHGGTTDSKPTKTKLRPAPSSLMPSDRLALRTLHTEDEGS